jgi:hypothetical protein
MDSGTSTLNLDAERRVVCEHKTPLGEAAHSASGPLGHPATMVRLNCVRMISESRWRKAAVQGGRQTAVSLGMVRDPAGGLTPAGRTFYKKVESAKLCPGVRGPADTPTKMRRKGSFLTRHFTTPRGRWSRTVKQPA